MNETGRNNWNGLQGMFIINDERERRCVCRRATTTCRYSFGPDIRRQPARPPVPVADPFDDRWDQGSTFAARRCDGRQPRAVDGRVTPYLDVAAHRYRFRLRKASNFESYDFALSDGRPFIQIGTGDSLLPRAIVRQNILLGPSQHADVIVDFHGALHKKIVLQIIPPSKRASAVIDNSDYDAPFLATAD